MQIQACNATLGAVITQIDLAHLSVEDFDELDLAWDKYAVLIFKDQHLTTEQQKAFSRHFGRLEKGLIQSSTNLLAHIGNVARDGRVVDADSLQVRFNKGNEQWHSDSSYKRVAAKASLLSARVVPSFGGETEWADQRAAYDELDDALKLWLDDKVAVHSYRYSHTWHGGLEILNEEDLALLPPVEHPIIRLHPRTGRKNLFVGRHASHIVGEDKQESRSLLKKLTLDATQPPRTFKHAWEVGDLVLWDNRCVLHRGHTFPLDEARDMVRTTIAGDDDDNEWAALDEGING